MHSAGILNKFKKPGDAVGTCECEVHTRDHSINVNYMIPQSKLSYLSNPLL